MSAKPKFENDIFISYSHLDNKPLSEKEDFEWITEFTNNLSKLLENYLGREPNIWRDNRGIRPNQDFVAKIEKALPQSAVMVPIFTPRYIESEWCEIELISFINPDQAQLDLVINDQFRVFKVIKTPLRDYEFPLKIQNATGYKFFQIDNDDYVQEFNKSMYPELRTAYFKRLDRLAQDISNLLLELPDVQGQENPTQAADSGKPTVYLSTTGEDIRHRYFQLRKELIDEGYRVIPNQELNGSLKESTDLVENWMAEAQLSVHIFGEEYSGKAKMQNEVSAQAVQNRELQRIIWIPKPVLDEAKKGEESTLDPVQVTFLDGLLNTEEMQAGASVISDTIEALSNNLLRRLKKLEQPPEPSKAKEDAPSAEESVPQYVYIIATKEDKDAVKPWKKLISEQGYEVRISRWKKDGSLDQEAYERALIDYESVLVYWGDGDEYWMEDTLDAINKSLTGPNQLRKMAFEARGVLIAEPELDEKEDFTSSSFHVMHSQGTPSAENLAPFFTDLKAAKS